MRVLASHNLASPNALLLRTKGTLGSQAVRPTSFFPVGIVCKHSFCYDCLADYKAILKGDNSAHKIDCPWHPDKLDRVMNSARRRVPRLEARR